MTAIQPQIVQLELQFKGPLVKDSYVDDLSQLLLLNPDYNYQHKIVWVKSVKSFYFLFEGDGTHENNWRKLADNALIQPYSPDEVYEQFECVYVNSKIYSAIQQVPIQKSPLSEPAYWLCIAGEMITPRYFFQNTHSVLLYTDIKNPLFEVILGDIVIDDETGEPVIDNATGLIKLENKEICSPYIKQREDLHNNQLGVPYEINFYEDSILSEQVSGYVNIK